MKHHVILSDVDTKLLKEALEGIRSRGQVKALGREIDRNDDLRSVASALAKARGVAHVDELDGKRLVRALLDRSEAAQVRRNPIHRDEEFICIHCSKRAERGGAQVRDHCPHCLHGRHVDDVPGDRSASCGGVMVPVEFSVEGRAGVIISYRCQACGYRFRVRAHDDDVLPKGLRLDS